jgi:2-methylcitrate dehydratase PrpD
VNIATELAQRVTALRYDDLPAQAVYWCKVALLDTLGVGLAGSLEDAPRLVGETLAPGDGACLLLGSRRRVGALDAALVNATAAHVLDFDNTAAYMGGHVSVVMVPALLAAAEAFGANGRDVLLAHAAGYEVGGRLGCAVNFHHSEKGWHPTWTLGVFAVTAACARLLKLDAAETATALAISTSLAGGTKANFGTMTKSLHAGECARAGLWAVLLARKGFTASLDAFEHQQGFFNVFNGVGNYDAARVLERWADPLEIVAPGASYKLYPCCYSTHSAVEAALTLVSRHGTFDADSLAAVDITLAPPRLLHTNRPDPKTGLEAKFSVQYCVTRALLDGRVVLGDFENDAYLDPRMRAVLPRVKALPYASRTFDSDDPYDVEIRITLKDGTVRQIAASYPLGRTSDHPIPPELIRAKFVDCAQRVLTRQAAVDAADALASFEQLDSVRDFMRRLEPAA